MKDILKPYQEKINNALSHTVSSLGFKTQLRDACEYALMNGGKRFRPALVLMVAEALGNSDCALPSAIAVEFFHTASLIADDLPCMDNDDFRRDKPSLHKVYGETTALLSTYALIAAGYEKIYANSKLLKSLGMINADLICCLALENASFNTGIQGATGGQFLDIFPEVVNEETIRTVIYQKTVTLFEISFVFGWLFGGGDLEKLHKIKQAAYHFGMAFQIVDDFLDYNEDLENKRLINYPCHVGKEKAMAVLNQEIEKLKLLLQELHLNTPSFSSLVEYLNSIQAAASLN